MYWRPPATGPPTPSRKNGSIFASAPPSPVEHDAGADAHDAHAELLGRGGLALPGDADPARGNRRRARRPRRSARRRAGRSSRRRRPRRARRAAARRRAGRRRGCACPARARPAAAAWRHRSSAARPPRRRGAPRRRGPRAPLPAPARTRAARRAPRRPSAARARSASRESTVTSSPRRLQRGDESAVSPILPVSSSLVERHRAIAARVRVLRRRARDGGPPARRCAGPAPCRAPRRGRRRRSAAPARAAGGPASSQPSAPAIDVPATHSTPRSGPQRSQTATAMRFVAAVTIARSTSIGRSPAGRGSRGQFVGTQSSSAPRSAADRVHSGNSRS